MAHYDLYSAIGLDRSLSSEQLIAEIDSKIASGQFDNPGGVEELRIARDVLGQDNVRRIYDTRLMDPEAPEITVGALRELSGQVKKQEQQAANSQSRQAAADVPGGDSKPGGFQERVQQNFDQLSTKAKETAQGADPKLLKSPKVLVIGTAVITLLVVLLVWGLFSLLGGSGGSVNGAKGTVNELMKLQEKDATSWVRDNVHRDSKDQVERTLFDDGDFVPFEDVVDRNEPQIGEAFNGLDLVNSSFYSSKRDMEEILEGESINNIAIVTINDRNGTDTGWRITLYQIDGDWLISDMSTATDVEDYQDVSSLF